MWGLVCACIFFIEFLLRLLVLLQKLFFSVLCCFDLVSSGHGYILGKDVFNFCYVFPYILRVMPLYSYSLWRVWYVCLLGKWRGRVTLFLSNLIEEPCDLYMGYNPIPYRQSLKTLQASLIIVVCPFNLKKEVSTWLLTCLLKWTHGKHMNPLMEISNSNNNIWDYNPLSLSLFLSLYIYIYMLYNL